MADQPSESRNRRTHYHEIWRGLAIYKVASSPFWKARYYDRAARRYVVSSTKETLKRDAIIAAEELVKRGTLLAPVVEVSKVVSYEETFEYFAKRAMDANRIKGKKFALRDDEKLLNRPDDGLLVYFGAREIEAITSAEITEYFVTLDDTRDEPLSASTKNKHRILLNKVFTAAINDKKLSRIPAIQTFSNEDAPKPAFDDAEFASLLKVTKECIKRGDVVRGIKITDEIYHMIRFLVYSFVRPLQTELMNIKIGDIVVRKNPSALELKINGKTGKRISITMPEAVEIYQAQIAFTGVTDKGSYLFFPNVENRATALSNARRIFNHILEKAKLKVDYQGNTRVLYSLRHYAIQKRLRDSGGKVNLYTLARNAGTSVEMLQRFYVAKMALSDELIQNLQYSTKSDETSGERPKIDWSKVSSLTPYKPNNDA